MSGTPEFKTNFRIPLRTDTTESSKNLIPTVVSPVNTTIWDSTYSNGGSFSANAKKSNGVKRKLEDHVMSEVRDSSLPKSLTELFQPLFCKLCCAHLNSTISARMHYMSKNHKKKMRLFLIEHSEKTGEPLHKLAKMDDEEKQDVDQNYLHCSICDLKLTSKLHADQHYMGKNHQKAASKLKKPAGSGYYDDNGEWHRSEKTPIDHTGRFGIGMAFAKPEELKQAAEAAAKSVTKSRYSCDLCNISATSADSLQMHLNGQKHKRAQQKATAASIQDDPFGDLGK